MKGFKFTFMTTLDRGEPAFTMLFLPSHGRYVTKTLVSEKKIIFIWLKNLIFEKSQSPWDQFGVRSSGTRVRERAQKV
jgi:hypothetical protein